ncbi:hypothetical protein ACFW9D_05805 [Streptomyces sp. NPDC059524]|uniref:hypothetical protein n=1 Tax=Streptomyces sp. NPDC059524 TaxID=3346856 RepID=UPI0036A1B35A
MATRTAAKKTAKKTAANKPRTRAARTTPAPTPADPTTLVDLRHPLPTRRAFVGPLGAEEQTAVRAALASAMARLPIPVLAWHGPTAHLADGTRITHTDPRMPVHVPPGQAPEFTAHVPCPYGAIHEHLVHSAAELTAAREITRSCTRVHSLDHQTELDEGVHPVPAPKPPIVVHLQEGIRRAHASAADTQPLTVDDIITGLHNRATNEQAREHPDTA